MPLFRRREPLHRRLAEDAGLSLDGAPAPGPAAAPPGWDGEQRGEPGIHGVPRARRWDAVVTVEAPGLRGDEVRFVALPDGTLLGDGDGGAAPDPALVPLGEALTGRLAPPYRAEAVRRGGAVWAVAGRGIDVVELPGLDGDEAEFVVTPEERHLTVDGSRRVAHVPALEAAGAAVGRAFVVRATRLTGELWEAEVARL